MFSTNPPKSETFCRGVVAATKDLGDHEAVQLLLGSAASATAFHRGERPASEADPTSKSHEKVGSNDLYLDPVLNSAFGIMD